MLFLRVMTVRGVVLVCAVGLVGCGSDAAGKGPGDGGSTGGASTGGAVSGGNGGTSAGGVSSGGTTAGGSSSGGSGTTCALGPDICDQGTTCRCCSGPGPLQYCLCTRPCSSSADCTDSRYPTCDLGTATGSGLCRDDSFVCCPTCN
jgi:hypothetical protein